MAVAQGTEYKAQGRALLQWQEGHYLYQWPGTEATTPTTHVASFLPRTRGTFSTVCGASCTSPNHLGGRAGAP
eukprot:7618747-Heterocapsa_arctica.AAC.1